MRNAAVDDYLSVRDAAKILDVSPAEVRGLLAEGEIDGLKTESGWSVRRGDLLKWLRRRQLNIADEEPYRDRQLATDSTTLQVLSFFSGAMGLDQGLERAGMSTLMACESDKASRLTIKANKPKLPVIGNIWHYDAQTIRALAGLDVDESPDVIAGGPPCQAFSTAGSRRGLDDTRGNVFMHFLQLITELTPRYAIIENVRGLLSMPVSPSSVPTDTLAQYGEPAAFSGKNGVIRLVVRTLESAGYSVSFNLYNAANFGSAQVRERVVIIAALGSSRVPYLMPTHSSDEHHGLPPWRTLRDVAGDLPTDGSYVEFPETRLKYFKLLSEGENWRSLPQDVQVEAMGKSYYLGGGKTGFYRRLSWDKPAPTLVTHPAMPATDLCHPTLLRPLSVEEYRRIQDFPDHWELAGSVIDQYRQIGNAVPVRLAEAIGRAIVAHSSGSHEEPPFGFPFSRYRGTSDQEILRDSSVTTLF